MSDHIYTLDELRVLVRSIAARYGVQRITLFGSYARGDASLNSDIDLRVDKGRIRGLLQLAGLQQDLEETLKTHVDLLTTDSLDEEFLKRISREEIVLYEQ